MVLHLRRDFRGITEHATVSSDYCNARAELAGELAADSVESDAGKIERNHAREQVRFLLHARAQGVDIKVTQQRVRRIIKTQEEQRDDGEIGKEDFCDETTVPKPFHRIYSQHLGA